MAAAELTIIISIGEEKVDLSARREVQRDLASTALKPKFNGAFASMNRETTAISFLNYLAKKTSTKARL